MMRTPAQCKFDAHDSAERLASRWLVIALAYFVAGVALGVAMSAAHDFRLRGVHVHVNLLGWVSMALMGLIYRAFPQAAGSALARWHFWTYQALLPVMLAGLAGVLLGNEQLVPMLAAGSVALAGSVLLFAIAIWRAAVQRRETSAVDFGKPQTA